MKHIHLFYVAATAYSIKKVILQCLILQCFLDQLLLIHYMHRVSAKEFNASHNTLLHQH